MKIKKTFMGHPWDIHGLVWALGFYRDAFASGVGNTGNPDVKLMFVPVYLCCSGCFADLSNQEISRYLIDAC